MPGHKPTRTASWAWFKAELERRLGKVTRRIEQQLRRWQALIGS